MQEQKYNVDLIGQTIGAIIVNPEDWHQDLWRCGSGMCFAGHAVALAGYKFVDLPTSDYADYVEDPQGTELWDRKDKCPVTPVATRLKSIIERYGEDLYTSAYALGLLAGAAEQAKAQVDDPQRFVKISMISTVARRELRLDTRTADILFSEKNTMQNLIDYSTALAKGERL